MRKTNRDQSTFFAFYPADFRIGTETMTNEEVGVYIRLLCFQFLHGNRIAIALRTLCGCIGTDEETARKVLGLKFEWVEDPAEEEGGYWINERLDSEVQKSNELRAKRSAAGAAGASGRWQKDGKRNGKRNANAMANAMAKRCHPEPEPEPDTNTYGISRDAHSAQRASDPAKEKQGRFTPPTLDEVEAYVREKGYADFDCEHFHSHYEANGWKQASGRPIRSWRAAVTTWRCKQDKFEKTQNAKQGGKRCKLEF